MMRRFGDVDEGELSKLIKQIEHAVACGNRHVTKLKCSSRFSADKSPYYRPSSKAICMERKYVLKISFPRHVSLKDVSVRDLSCLKRGTFLRPRKPSSSLQ